MPLVRIDLIERRSAMQVAAIGNAIQRALVDCLDVPERDQFQVISEHSPGRLIYNSGYLGVERGDRDRTGFSEFRAIHGTEAGVLRPCSRASRSRSSDTAGRCHDCVD